ncbi:hypothetical protein EDC04DRAFT_2892117 [Pisolithus marmoratus]|nr:hypothetical protein EDC04DRAFT_2892117 [Pisolithus marmoratus]
MTADNLPLNEPQKLVFAHPWIRHIQGPNCGLSWGGDFDSGTDSDSDSYFDAASDEDEDEPPSPFHTVLAPQVDDYTLALQIIARLGQPFNALLLVQQPNGEYNGLLWTMRLSSGEPASPPRVFRRKSWKFCELCQFLSF